MVPERFQDIVRLRRNSSLFLDWVLHSSAWIKSTTMRCWRHLVYMEDIDHVALRRAFLREVRQRGAFARKCSVIECDGHCERRLSSTRSTQHVYFRNESERRFIDMSLLKESKAECAHILMEIKMCERKVLSGFREHSSILVSTASVLFVLTIKSAKRCMFEPPGACSVRSECIFRGVSSD